MWNLDNITSKLCVLVMKSSHGIEPLSVMNCEAVTLLPKGRNYKTKLQSLYPVVDNTILSMSSWALGNAGQSNIKD